MEGDAIKKKVKIGEAICFEYILFLFSAPHMPLSFVPHAIGVTASALAPIEDYIKRFSLHPTEFYIIKFQISPQKYLMSDSMNADLIMDVF